ncbi:hypothetical protein AWG53_06910 [Escherichia coli]|nr:hypothetical protein AWG53_06910 [Escherichia coli]
MTSLKTSIKTITYLSDIGCLEIQGASLVISRAASTLAVTVISFCTANAEPATENIAATRRDFTNTFFMTIPLFITTIINGPPAQTRHCPW